MVSPCSASDSGPSYDTLNLVSVTDVFEFYPAEYRQDLKVLISVDFSRHLVMVVSALVSMA